MSFNLHMQLRIALTAIRKPHHTPAHIAVLEVFAYRINDMTGICFPSVATIAAESFLSERHARKVIRQLEEDGLVSVTERVRKSSHYSLTLPVSVAYAAGQNRLYTKAGLEVPEPGSEATQDGSEARLTYNLNQSHEVYKERCLCSC